MFEFVGDVYAKDVKAALVDTLEEEYGLISRAEDNGFTLLVDIRRGFDPIISLDCVTDQAIRAQFTAEPIIDEHDVIVGCRFNPVITNAGLTQQNVTRAEKQFYRWYQFATIAKEIASVEFYPYDYLD